MSDTPSIHLDVRALTVRYPGVGRRTRAVNAVDDVSFAVPRGRTLGIVGESGSGKSTIGRAILGLAPVTAGSIRLDGEEIARAPYLTRRRLSSKLQVVFQDPYGSLNPHMTVGQILTEPLVSHGVWNAEGARARVADLLRRVGLPEDAMERLPREFSGGQRQRIAIARALAIHPELIICDEPTSALDLSTQAQVLNLLLELQASMGLTLVFISHDLAVVRHIAHEIAVVRHGRIVEHGEAATVSDHPSDPYTRRLLMSSPVPDPAEQRARRAALATLDVPAA